MKIKGFRPGKVPRAILERYYKSQVEDEVMTRLITDSYGKAVQENNLAPVAAPTVVDRAYESGKEFKYTVTVEVKPEITVSDYLGQEVEKETAAVADDEVEARLKALQDGQAQLKTVEVSRPVQAKDFVLFDFEGTLEGKPLDGWKVKDHLAEAGSKTLVGSLDEKLIGLAVNEEKDLTITLPESTSQKELAGKEVSVHVKVKEIKEKILPALDDEFGKDFGDFPTLADLKAHQRKTILEQKEALATAAAKERLLSALVAKESFAVPKSMVDHRVKNMISRMEMRLARQGLKLESANLNPEKMQETLRPAAEKDVRGSLILDKIGELENIQVSDADLDKRFAEMAAQLNQPLEAIKAYYQKEDLVEDLRAQIREENTLDFLLSKAKIVEKAPETAQPATPEEKK